MAPPALRHTLRRVVDTSDPLRAAAWTGRPVPAATLLCVYRRRNAERVVRLCAHARQLGLQVRLWALDDPAPELAADTAGTGPGGRFQLLNALAAEVPAGRWLLVSDDDVDVTARGLRALLAWSLAFDLDLAQPAHARHGSYFFHKITARKAWCVARETTFVEIGPVLVVSARARDEVLPFPEEGMGWGVELLWYDLERAGARLGIVDVAVVRHVAPVGLGYDAGPEMERLRGQLRARGVEHWEDLQRTSRRLYPWSRIPADRVTAAGDS